MGRLPSTDRIRRALSCFEVSERLAGDPDGMHLARRIGKFAATTLSVVGGMVGTVEVMGAWQQSVSGAARAHMVDARTEARSDWT